MSMRAPITLGVLSLLVAACGGRHEDLQAYIDQVKARPGGRIEPLPQVLPYETFTYRSENQRSPFLPTAPQTVDRSLRPDANRRKEYLEQFPLDTLDMVGTMVREGQTYALVQTQDGLIHRVVPGNYLGQNDGRVVGISESEIQLEELVPDGIGGFFEREAAIGLAD